MSPPIKPKPRVRVMYRTVTEGGGGHWQAVLVNREGDELDASPPGTEVEAERYMDNWKRYGTWLKS